jgi:hypothetical protein
VCLYEGDCPSLKGDNSKRVKTMKKYKKKKNTLFSRSSRQKPIKLAINYHWVKVMYVYSNKGPGPLQRGDNHKNVKIGWGL